MDNLTISRTRLMCPKLTQQITTSTNSKQTWQYNAALAFKREGSVSQSTACYFLGDLCMHAVTCCCRLLSM